MTKKLYEAIETPKMDDLIVDAYPPTITYLRQITAGEGELKRGAVLAIEGGKYKLMTTGGAPNAILAEDIDATTEAVAPVYVSGHFASNKLITKDEYELTAEDKDTLRTVNIYVADALEY